MTLMSDLSLQVVPVLPGRAGLVLLAILLGLVQQRGLLERQQRLAADVLR